MKSMVPRAYGKAEDQGKVGKVQVMLLYFVHPTSKKIGFQKSF